MLAVFFFSMLSMQNALQTNGKWTLHGKDHRTKHNIHTKYTLIHKGRNTQNAKTARITSECRSKRERDALTLLLISESKKCAENNDLSLSTHIGSRQNSMTIFNINNQTKKSSKVKLNEFCVHGAQYTTTTKREKKTKKKRIENTHWIQSVSYLFTIFRIHH